MKDFGVIQKLKDHILTDVPNFKSWEWGLDSKGNTCACCGRYTNYRASIEYSIKLNIPICDNYYCLAFSPELFDFYLSKFKATMTRKENYKIYSLISKNLLTNEIGLFDNKNVVPVKLKELKGSEVYPAARKIFKKYSSRAIYIFDGSALISKYRECSSCKRQVKTQNLTLFSAASPVQVMRSDHYFCKQTLECNFCSSLL
jgi:hypothetical protein